MGRRKQFCPQRTGMLEANYSKEHINEEDELEEQPSENGDEDMEAIKEEEEDEGVEDEEEGQREVVKPPSNEVLGYSSEFANSLFAAQQSLFAPAALLSLNPSSLYAVQLAQLQAAQLLSQPSLKRKLAGSSSSEESASSSSTTPSPLDLSRGPEESPSDPKRPSPLDKMSDLSAKAAKPPRHSAWQSQWINRGEENAKDIFKCTWCKETFHSFQALTTHMKETKHFGSPPGGPFKSLSPTPPTHPISPPLPKASSPLEQPKKRDILKEQLPIPRKLVRGQDVWLGKGEEQTRNILKCMWCGESFRSLEAMTKHMQATKHYTKVISQDQLSSWKGPASPPSPPKEPVLACRVCEASFPNLKDLSEHMMKSGHGSPPPTMMQPGPKKAPPPPKTEKRKKSLPVKKLLELERSSEKGATMKFPCDKCGISFPFHLFADHIRHCNGSPEPRRAESLSPPSTSPVSSRRSESRDGNILGSLEQMVSGGGFKTKADDPVVIPLIKESGEEDDIAVDDEEEVDPQPPPLRKPKESNKNPLEALQMLCDKNEKHSANFYAGGSSALGPSPPEWSPEALFKCPFCESPFVSKGAYRNHLTKNHFVKDPSVMMMMDPAAIMALAAGIPSGFFPPPHVLPTQPPSPYNMLPASPNKPNEEASSSSKFEKYSQLAKQLSNQRKPLSSPA